MTDSDAQVKLEAVVRGIATAGKTLKLYPSSSPIPREAAETAANALASYLEDNPVLALTVDRAGFRWAGESLGSGVAGAVDLAGELQDHGIAEVDFMPGCSVDNLVDFLGISAREPDDVRAAGGMGMLLVADGIDCIRVTDVHLTVVEDEVLAPDDDIEGFLKRLAADPEQLATWLAAASSGDPHTFAEGLGEIADVVGPEGLPKLMETLSTAFMAQEQDGKDTMLGLAMDPGIVNELAGGMFQHLGAGDIASSVCEGLYGQNMLSLSNALTSLPLQERMRQVYDQVQAEMEGIHSDKEIGFLEHMMEVREREEPETRLLDTDATYSRIASAVDIQADEIERLRAEAQDASTHVGPASVTTMLALLDQQASLELYCTSVDNLSAMVPRLLAQGDVALAQRVVSELATRRDAATPPFPEAPARIESSLQAALSEHAMQPLITAAVDDRSVLPQARDIVRQAGDAAVGPLVIEAIELKYDGVEVAEEILGARLVDQLIAITPQAQWYQLGPIVERLAKETDPRAVQAVQSALNRSDEQSRREAAQGVAASGGPAAATLLGDRVNDESTEVAIIAVRAMAKYDVVGSAPILAKRLDGIDIDGDDFVLAREIIGALARLDDPAALAALKKLAGRKALIKRGHFADVQELAKQGLALQEKRGGGR